MIPASDLKERYAAAKTGDDKCNLLASVELTPAADLVDFLTAIAQDAREFDLARIEAMRALALVGAENVEHHEAVAETLVALAVGDKDEDVQGYALQYLEWFAGVAWIPKRIEPLLDPCVYVLIRRNALCVLAAQKTNPDARRIIERLQSDPTLGKSAKRALEGA